MGEFAGLNQAQQDAVSHDDGPLAVLAGPGAGKTRMIVHRIARLIDGGAEPGSIVAVTFTVKAAAQMRQRLGEALGPHRRTQADAVNVHTFHGLGRRLVRRFGDLLGLPPGEKYIDSSQQRTLLREIIERRGLFRQWLSEGLDALSELAVEQIDALSNHAIEPQEAEQYARTTIDGLRREAPGMTPEQATGAIAELERFAQLAHLTGLYRDECRRRGWLSFGDLNTLPIALMEQHPSAAAIVRGEWRHAVVDEFQDVNPAQVRMLTGLFPPGSRPDVCVVADDDQSIYAFRGADPRALEKFDKDYAPRVVMLTENYRSQRCIIDVGNAVIAASHRRFRPDKKIERARGAKEALGAAVECGTLDHFRQDGEVIAAMVLAARAASPGLGWDRLAVLARTHPDLDRVEQALLMEGIPVQRRGLRSPADDEGVKDVLAWARLLAEPTDATQARRLLVRPPVGVAIERVGEWERRYNAALQLSREEGSGATHPGPYSSWLATQAADEPTVQRFAEVDARLRERASHQTADEVLALVVRESGVAGSELLPAMLRARRVASLVSLLRFARSRQDRLPAPGDIRAFWTYYERLDEAERSMRSDERIDAEDSLETDEGDGAGVMLLTAHAAKGLEFDTVFVTRVQAQHGFPKKGGQERTDIPRGLQRWPSENPGEDREDEERRLFYVACTRAERRLVILGNAPKGKSTAVNYYKELTGSHSKLVVTRTAAEALAAASAARGKAELVWEQGEFRTVEARRALVQRFKEEARAAAAAALDRADDAALTVEALEAVCEELRRSAQRLAIAAAVGQADKAPVWVRRSKDRALVDEAARLEDAVARVDEAAGSVGLAATVKRLCRPLPAPLRLSYSQIEQYDRCPLCYYLKHVMHLPEARLAQRDIGVLAHSALSRFYTQWRLADAEGHAKPGKARLLELGDAECELRRREGWTTDASERDEVRSILSLTFEKLHDESAHITEFMEQNIEMPYVVDGAAHTLIAKPDRVDDLGGGRYRIIDFKAGKAWKKLTEPEDDNLQMGIYAMALDHLFGDGGRVSVGGRAEFWLLRTGQRGVLDLDAIRRDKVAAKIDKAVRGMLAGNFMRTKAYCEGPCSILLRG